MTKSVKICLFIVIFLFVSAVITAAIFYRTAECTAVEIVQDNKVLYTLDLSKETDRTFRIESPNGGWNEIKISDGTIRVINADCPDKTCVHTGVLRSEHMPIVCLPHKLVIRFAEDGET